MPSYTEKISYKTTLKQVEYQNWAYFKELKTPILYSFRREYIIKSLFS